MLFILVMALAVAAAQDIRIGVVESQPERAAQLAAAVDAALRAVAADAAAADGDAGAADASEGGGGGGGAGGDELPEPARLAPVEPHEPLAVPAHVCEQAGEGVHATLGGEAGAAAAARAGLLLLLAAPGPLHAAGRAARPAAATLALYPHPDTLAAAIVALYTAKGWREAVVLHEGSARSVPLLAAGEAAGGAGGEPAEEFRVRARQLPAAHDDDALRNLLLVLKRWGAVNFIVWCEAACSVRVLDAAQRVGLLAERHSYLLPALDLHTQPLDAYSHGGANITALRLFDPESAAVRRAMAAWRLEYRRRLGDVADDREIAQIVANPPTALLLAYDAARIAAQALAQLRLPPAAPGDCARGSAAFHADTLLNYIRSREWGGASSEAALRWEAGGARRAVPLLAGELAAGGRLRTAAAWAPRDGLAWRARAAPPPPPSDLMTNRTFVVLIAENSPYIMRQLSTDRLAGNDRYEGFCIELIDQLAQLLQFNYTFEEQPDGRYGTYNKTTNEWNGMMKRLMEDQRIDFAITDLTITAEREKAVDFTTPFMNLGISILFRKPQPPKPALLAFLLPFSGGVWLCLGLAYLGTSLVLYVVGRLCPEEWQNPYPCVEEPAALENQFTLANALWFNLGAVLMQGSEIAPVAYGSRAVASAWWIFAIVIVNSYTANLATLLGTKTSNELIHDVRELADNEFGITYGAKLGGSTYTFFELSNNDLYRRMFQKMKEQEMPSSNEAGIDKVLKENYAFFAESTTIEYTIERNCEVTMVGELLDSKGYGIAMRKNSPYRHSLNLALLNLQESGVLQQMKQRWWKEKHGGGACQPNADPSNEELSMRNFLGLFLVLVVGCVLGVLLSCCELLCAAWRRPRDPSASLARSYWHELCFVFRFDLSEKPVRGPLLPPSPPSPPATRSPSEAPSERPSESASEREPGEARERSASHRSHRSRRPSARRSSMHNASLRLARHTSPTQPQ